MSFGSQETKDLFAIFEPQSSGNFSSDLFIVAQAGQGIEGNGQTGQNPAATCIAATGYAGSLGLRVQTPASLPGMEDESLKESVSGIGDIVEGFANFGPVRTGALISMTVYVINTGSLSMRLDGAFTTSKKLQLECLKMCSTEEVPNGKQKAVTKLDGWATLKGRLKEAANVCSLPGDYEKFTLRAAKHRNRIHKTIGIDRSVSGHQVSVVQPSHLRRERTSRDGSSPEAFPIPLGMNVVYNNTAVEPLSRGVRLSM